MHFDVADRVGVRHVNRITFAQLARIAAPVCPEVVGVAGDQTAFEGAQVLHALSDMLWHFDD